MTTLEKIQQEALEEWRTFIDPRLIGYEVPWPLKQAIEGKVSRIVARAYEAGEEAERARMILAIKLTEPSFTDLL